MADWTSEDWAATMRAARAGRHELPSGIGPWLGRLLILHPRLVAAIVPALLALVVGLAVHRHWAPPPAEPQEARPVLQPPAWSAILKPTPGFVLDTPLFPREEVVLSARRHNPGGGREDIISLGRPGGPGPFGRVVAYRTGSEAGPPGTLFLELARRTAEDGFALVRSVQPAPLPSKFGAVESAEMVLAVNGRERRCAAWRIVADEQDLRVTGWLCGAEGAGIDRAVLSCLVDRLDVSPSQTDTALRTFFKDTERRRVPGCAAPRPVSAGRRPA